VMALSKRHDASQIAVLLLAALPFLVISLGTSVSAAHPTVTRVGLSKRVVFKK
jgi:hypothetical protein